MTDVVRRRVHAIKEDLEAKKKVAGWVLPRQQSSLADEGTW
jgi:NCS1 family nucleobase:cation symporter-1